MRIRDYSIYIFITIYSLFVGIYQISLVLHGKEDFNSYLWIFVACIWTIRWVTALVRWVKEHRLFSKLFTKRSSSWFEYLWISVVMSTSTPCNTSFNHSSIWTCKDYGSWTPLMGKIKSSMAVSYLTVSSGNRRYKHTQAHKPLTQYASLTYTYQQAQ